MERSALITGASAGIGRKFAEELARRGGLNLVLVARRGDRLDQTKAACEAIWSSKTVKGEERAITISTDLRLEPARMALFQEMDLQGLQVELLINNAGFGSLGSFAKADPATQLDMAVVNCIAPLHLMRLFLPRMTERGKGAIINVASVCSFVAMPYMATYGATKAFLLSLSLAVANEVASQGVSVQALCPGPTDSEFHIVAGLPEKLSYLPPMSAEAVVCRSLDRLEKRSKIVITGALNQFLVRLARLLPAHTGAVLVERVLRRHR